MRNPQRGFTLTELIMVMVMLGILAAFAMPRFFDVGTYQARFVYDDVLAAARYGRQTAVASGCATKLVVTTTGFQLLSNDLCAASGTLFTTNIVPHPAGDTSAFNLTSLPSGVSFTAATVVFNTDGTASANTTINVSGRTITIVAATGYVY